MPKNIPIRLRGVRTPHAEFGDVMYPPTGRCLPRQQAQFQLVLIVEGDARVKLDGHEVLIAAGQVGLFLPGRWEHFLFSEERRTHHTWCCIHPALVDAALQQSAAVASPVTRVSHRLSQLLEIGLGLPMAAEREDQGLVEVLAVAALREYIFAARSTPGATGEPDAVRRLLGWFGLYASEPTDLPALAQIAGVSPSQLVKLCRQHLGVTPIRALWEARTRRGVRMLGDTGLTVGEIAFRCGFQTPFHFSRWVRELTGFSPRGVRSRRDPSTAPETKSGRRASSCGR